eukprot:CAMPEP_0119260184 /NCGR_PEP_ID=MMETSP1329-20130426/694_1 /TAXON_ID=114041 /ORGANISM="Genus nov. species nov., Strain RCC1024" /LENGTH=138 /DNA_ID=CAMNT_0007259605 /DNA_START=172 /DNA_END=585 /DNA_ORIENTATION=+
MSARATSRKKNNKTTETKETGSAADALLKLLEVAESPAPQPKRAHRPRRPYRCGRCGQPKSGHICPMRGEQVSAAVQTDYTSLHLPCNSLSLLPVRSASSTSEDDDSGVGGPLRVSATDDEAEDVARRAPRSRSRSRE